MVVEMDDPTKAAAEAELNRTNFFRVCRIVVDHVPGVLREVFKREVKARYGHVWDDTPNSGDWLMKTPGGVERWRRNLNKDQKRDISSGDCNKWDPTLLFHTLLYSSLCLLADEIPKATLNQDTLTLAAPDPKVAVGCKVIIDMGNEHFSREITKQLPPTMPPTTFRLTSKVPKSPNAVYLCGEKYDAVNKLRLHRNKRYAHVKAAAISTEDLNQLIEEVEDIWIELYDTRDDFRRWKNALKAIKSEVITEPGEKERLQKEFEDMGRRLDEHDAKINEQGAQIGELRVRVDGVEETMEEIGSRNKVDQQNGMTASNGSATSCTTKKAKIPLTIDDRPKVVKYLVRIGNIQTLLLIGESLGLDGTKLTQKKITDTFLFDLVGDWLCKTYKVAEKGMPSWNKLVEVLEEVGQEGLANDIRKDVGL